MLNPACDLRIAQSPHSGGITLAMSDGSVRFLSADADADISWALCAAEGGEGVPGN